MSNRTVYTIGGVGLAGVGYYFYQAGGNAKGAQKRAELDGTKASNVFKSDTTATKDKASASAQVIAADAGAELDRLAREAKDTTHKVDAKLEQYRKEAENKLTTAGAEARKEASDAVDNFDKTVTRKASEAKSGMSSWFGFGGK